MTMHKSNEEILKDYELNGSELEILTYPDPILTTKATEITEFNSELAKTCTDMLYTMYKSPGIGLAAPQVGISKRFLVLDVDYEMNEKTLADGRVVKERINFNPHIFINPVIVEHEGKTKYQEGCLSLPTVYEDVTRFEQIKIEYQNLAGDKCSMQADGLLSICLQHEIDHLNGIVFIDHLSSLKKSFFRKKLLKLKRR